LAGVTGLSESKEEIIMSRNHYTRLIHDQNQAHLNEKIRDLDRLARSLRSQPTGLVEPPVEIATHSDRKALRRARLEHKRLHKPTLPSADVAAIPQLDPSPTSNALAA
jgi:hypothetical protein